MFQIFNLNVHCSNNQRIYNYESWFIIYEKIYMHVWCDYDIYIYRQYPRRTQVPFFKKWRPHTRIQVTWQLRIIITECAIWGQTLKTETAILVLGMSRANISIVVLSHWLGNRVWLSQLGWPGQSTQTIGEMLNQYKPACIQGKKCSNGIY